MTNEKSEFALGQRVVLQRHGERTYATVVAAGSKPDTIWLDVDGRYYNPQEHWRGDLIEALAARDMVIGDLLNLTMLKEVFEKPFLGTLWTDGDSGMLTPYVCECSFGDGLKLIRIFTINQRPNYHVVRVHSGWKTSNWSCDENVGEYIDEILTAIESECGPARYYCDDCGCWPCECGDQQDYDPDRAFPALDDENGCSWSNVSWNWLMMQIAASGAVLA